MKAKIVAITAASFALSAGLALLGDDWEAGAARMRAKAEALLDDLSERVERILHDERIASVGTITADHSVTESDEPFVVENRQSLMTSFSACRADRTSLAFADSAYRPDGSKKQNEWPDAGIEERTMLHRAVVSMDRVEVVRYIDSRLTFCEAMPESDRFQQGTAASAISADPVLRSSRPAAVRSIQPDPEWFIVVE
jgi:hypothetical protein